MNLMGCPGQIWASNFISYTLLFLAQKYMTPGFMGTCCTAGGRRPLRQQVASGHCRASHCWPDGMSLCPPSPPASPGVLPSHCTPAPPGPLIPPTRPPPRDSISSESLFPPRCPRPAKAGQVGRLRQSLSPLGSYDISNDPT